MTEFVCFRLGEGVEKAENDFAAEVAAAVRRQRPENAWVPGRDIAGAIVYPEVQPPPTSRDR